MKHLHSMGNNNYARLLITALLLGIKTLTGCEKNCKLFAPESNLSHKGSTEYVAVK